MPPLFSTHTFEDKTFSKPTYCDYCNKLLWGIAKQGVCCRVCGYVSHFNCKELASSYCTISEVSDFFAASRNIEHKSPSSLNNIGSIKSEPSIHNKPIPIQEPRSSTHTTSESLPAIKVTFGMDDINKIKNNSSQEQQNNKNLPVKLKRSSSVDSITDYSSSSSNQTKPLQYYATLPGLSSSKSAEIADIAPRAAKPLSPTKPSFDTKMMQDVLISSVINVSNTSKLPSDSTHPPLNLNTTTNNFRNFVRKCGFIFELQDAVEDIIMWKNTPNTLLAMVIYVYICLYPQLLLLLPFVGLFSILISYHQKRFPDGPNMNENGGKKMFKRSNHVDPYLPPENSVDYLKNMRNIQNLMGMISDGYDAFVPLLKHVDWSNEYETLKITQIVIVILSILSLTVWLVPWRYIFVVVGLNVFIANTQLAKALIKEISPILMQRAKIFTQVLIEEVTDQKDTNNDVKMEDLIKEGRVNVDSSTAGSSST